MRVRLRWRGFVRGLGLVVTSNEIYEDAVRESEAVKAEACALIDEPTRKEFLENWPLDDRDERW